MKQTEGVEVWCASLDRWVQGFDLVSIGERRMRRAPAVRRLGPRRSPSARTTCASPAAGPGSRPAPTTRPVDALSRTDRNHCRHRECLAALRPDADNRLPAIGAGHERTDA